MLLTRLLSKIYKKNGIILIDAKGEKYILGKPNLSKPLTVKLLKEDLNWKLLLNPDLNFPEAYMSGDIQIENGTLLDFFNMTFENIGRGKINTLGHLSKTLMHAWRFVSNYNLPTQSKRNVEHHYDIGEDLYDLFLDKKHRQYSCAYFKNKDDSLEDAQNNKINHIIKKLDLRPGQKVLDIGCGWGGMAFEIARQSKCEVLGISLSENQINYCKDKAKELKMDNQVNFQLCDYREVKEKFQKIVSVGAFEHIGKKFYKIFFKKINDILTNDGICLLHTIGSVNAPSPVQPFIQKRIFPGGVVPCLSELTKPIEQNGLVISDCETLIHHYDKTLESWLKRFMENKDKATSMFNKEFVRMWECYLSMCAAAFKYRDLVVYQLQLVKNFTSPPSNRRNYIYQ